MCLCASRRLIGTALIFFCGRYSFTAFWFAVGFSIWLADRKPFWFDSIKEELLSCAWPVLVILFALCRLCAYYLFTLVILDHFSGLLLAEWQLWDSIIQRKLLRKNWSPTCFRWIRFTLTVHDWHSFFESAMSMLLQHGHIHALQIVIILILSTAASPNHLERACVCDRVQAVSH